MPEVARSRARRAMIVACVACVLAAGSYVVAAILFARSSHNDHEIQNSRVAVTDTICDGIGTLIIRGAVGSRPFEPLYRRYGAPRYELRVKAARKDARVLCLKIRRQTDSPQP